MGNRAQEATLAGTPVITYDIANRRTNFGATAYSLDDNGNLLSNGSFSYAASRFVAINTNVQTFEYDRLGHRLRETAGGTITYTLDAVEYFQAKVVGIPADVTAQLRHAPFRPALEAMAHTLVYEAALLGDGSLPSELAAAVTVPTLAIAGGASFPFMRETAQALAGALPDGRSRTFESQTDDIVPAVLAPVLAEFFAGTDGSRPSTHEAATNERTRR